MIDKRALEEAQDDDETENKNALEISINYVNTGNLLNHKGVNIDEMFFMNKNDDPEPRTMNECQNRHGWKIGRML